MLDSWLVPWGSLGLLVAFMANHGGIDLGAALRKCFPKRCPSTGSWVAPCPSSPTSRPGRAVLVPKKGVSCWWNCPKVGVLNVWWMIGEFCHFFCFVFSSILHISRIFESLTGLFVSEDHQSCTPGFFIKTWLLGTLGARWALSLCLLIYSAEWWNMVSIYVLILWW